MYSRRLPDTDAVFPGNRSDESESVGSLRKTFELVREAAKLPHFKFHSLRHYFISWCVMSGADLLTIAGWAGHSDTLLISRVYGHLNASHRRETAKKVVFGTQPEQSTPTISGTSVDLSKITAAELLNIYARRAAREGHAFRFSAQDYEVFADVARRMGQALERLGIEPGDRVATLAMNHDRHLAAWFGVVGMGGVPDSNRRVPGAGSKSLTSNANGFL